MTFQSFSLNGLWFNSLLGQSGLTDSIQPVYSVGVIGNPNETATVFFNNKTHEISFRLKDSPIYHTVTTLKTYQTCVSNVIHTVVYPLDFDTQYEISCDIKHELNLEQET